MNLSSLKHRNFRLLWLGQAISQLGDAFYYLVFLFMVKKITGSSALVGYVGALESIPYLLFGAYAGVIADRLDRRQIMLWSDLGSALILAAFAVVTAIGGQPPVWTLLVTPFALSSVRCFFMPAKSAALPRLVPDSVLPHANALSSGTQTVAGLVSLSISASVLSLLYAISPTRFYVLSIGLNAFSFFLSAWFISRLNPVRPERTDHLETHPIQDFKDGLAYIGGRRDLKALTVMLAVFRMTVAPFFVVYLAANDKWFGGKPQTIVTLEMFFTIGMLIATFAMAHVKAKRPLLWFGNGLAICGLTVLAMPFSPTFWGFAFWQGAAGLAIPPADIPLMTYLQLSVPDAYRGRVNSVRDTISMGVMPIGMVLGGLLVDKVGLVASFVLMGVGMILGCAYGVVVKEFREARMPEEGGVNQTSMGFEQVPSQA